MDTKTIPAGQFKAKCLALLDEVERTGGELVVTKRGRPVARVVPATTKERKKKARSLRGSIKFLGDIVAPIGEKWDAEEGKWEPEEGK